MRAVRQLLAACCLVIVGGTVGANEPDRPVIKACGHHNYPPWNWERGGHIVGACATVARRAIESLGYRVDLSYVGPWKRCQAMVRSGQVDVNICSFRNPERDAYSHFVEPRMGQNRIAVFARRDFAERQKFERWDDLKGLRTGLVIGVSMGPEFDGFLEQHTHVERTPDVQNVLKMMERGRIDIAPFGWEAGAIEIERAGLTGRIVPLPQPALVGELFISVSRRSPLAARLPEIGRYLQRPEYAEELRGLLNEHSRAFLTQ